ncbi:MAG: hypothetical protein ACM31E_09435 [Fibrobacterota bacterium]|nr:hypothetical protein [Chitinispirillaceae bacterium]
MIDSLQVGSYTVNCVVPNGYASDTISRTVDIVDQQVTTADFVLNIPEHCITNLAARAKLDKIQLTWTNDGSSEYHIFRSEESALSGFEQIDTTTSAYSTYLDTGLVIGKRYWYKVIGDGSCGTPLVVSAIPEDRVRR